MNRTDGYTTDVSYPAFFYKEMQPVWLSSVARFLGFAAPELHSPFAFCELGCGVGINLLVAAASHPEGHFVGVDFNEKHLQIARDAARASGLRNIEFIHSGFAEFERANRTPFDFIVTHGVWSWIAPQHQAGLLACVSASLKPGGIFYLHYMCHPGSTDMLAIQHFLNVFSHHIPGTSAQRVEAGLKLLRQLGERGLFVDKPGMLAKLQGLEHKDPAHLAHEFLTDHWRPQHAVEVHQQVGEAGLAYLGSADVFNNLDPGLSIPGGLQAAVRQVAAPALAETVKDMARNSHQRMDLFQREPRPLSREARFAALDATVFVMLPGAPTSGAVSFASPIGNIAGPAEIFSPLLQALAAGPVSFANLAALPAFAGQAGLLFQSLQLLMLAGFAHPLKPVPTPANAAAHKLAQWFAMRGVSLRLVDECATAVATGPD